ncbi:hypothetical protein DID88_001103 [Monilinia fructigena]|uniref:Uncharacterized protein n=1 Tax=Monilinia fructigena TaxID=38457 RepID=A0A395J0E2_9HELO|nr:hypothetical protein DID88_001103 [Monilinia fructigena]
MSTYSSDEIFDNWMGIIEDDFSKTILERKLKYHYQDHGKVIQVPLADIDAYTSIFCSKTDTSKALIAFSSNAKRTNEAKVNAVDNMASEYRKMWISDTEKADGVEYLRRNAGGKNKLC